MTMQVQYFNVSIINLREYIFLSNVGQYRPIFFLTFSPCRPSIARSVLCSFWIEIGLRVYQIIYHLCRKFSVFWDFSNLLYYVDVSDVGHREKKLIRIHQLDAKSSRFELRLILNTQKTKSIVFHHKEQARYSARDGREWARVGTGFDGRHFWPFDENLSCVVFFLRKYSTLRLSPW